MKKHLGARIFLVIPLLTIFYIILSLGSRETVNIIYFYNSKCIVHVQADSVVSEAEERFGRRINVTRIFASGFQGDPEDSPEVKDLRERYNAVGVPVIIIGNEEYKKSYDFGNFRMEICKQFKIKPIECMIG